MLELQISDIFAGIAEELEQKFRSVRRNQNPDAEIKIHGKSQDLRLSQIAPRMKRKRCDCWILLKCPWSSLLEECLFLLI